jgi:hypothetical protein
VFLYVFVYAREVLLVEHAKFDIACGCGEDDVERITQDGCVGYAVDRGEVEECEGLLEAIEDAYRGEEEVAYNMLAEVLDCEIRVRRTLLASSVRLDMIRLLALPVTFWHCAREFVRIWEDDLFPGPCLYQAMMYSLSHWSWSWIFAFDYVLSCRLLKRPDYWLWR